MRVLRWSPGCRGSKQYALFLGLNISSTLPGIVMKSLTARKYKGKDRSRVRGETHVASEVNQLDADFLELYSCRMDLDPRLYVIS